MRFNYLSPDGIPVSPVDFRTREEADTFFESWLRKYEAQGYYMSSSGPISFDRLRKACELDVDAGFLAGYDLSTFDTADAVFVVTSPDDDYFLAVVKNSDNPYQGLVDAIEGAYDEDVQYDESTEFREDPDGRLHCKVFINDGDDTREQAFVLTSKIPY